MGGGAQGIPFSSPRKKKERKKKKTKDFWGVLNSFFSGGDSFFFRFIFLRGANDVAYDAR